MESYCVRCKKYVKNINSKVSTTSNVKQQYQNVQRVVVKNRDLLENKNQKDYKVI